MTVARLPALRSDLVPFAGPDALDGSPTTTLYDPVSGAYKRLGWAESTILAHWRVGSTLDQLAARLAERSTLRVERQDLEAFVASVHASSLLVPTAGEGAALEARRDSARRGRLARLVGALLYVRVPLCEPDAFLRRTLPLVRPLASAPLAAFYLAVLAAAVVAVAPRAGEYLHTFPHYLTPAGLAAYAAVLVGLKVVHEFAHAYAAVACGVRVRSMGVVFILLWPVPYSDLTDAWRLAGRGPRLAMGFAGVGAELVLAALSLAGWCLAPPGLASSLFFCVSSVTLVTTVVVNLNPALRFDGYYLLADLWGIDNLQARAFALTRWALHRALLGMRLPPPEAVSRRRLAGLIVYSLYSWAYRAGLYFGIALIVYHMFGRALGAVLFAFQIWYLLLRPLAAEVRFLVRARKLLSLNRRSAATLALLVAAFAWFAAPLPRTVSMSAIVVPVRSQTVYAPGPGILRRLEVRRGDVVASGQVLFEIVDAGLETELELVRRDLAILEARQRSAAASERDRESLVEIARALGRARAQREELEERKRRCTVRAAGAGTVVRWDEGLRVGQAVKGDEVAGEIAGLAGVRVVAYVPERHLRGLEARGRVRFVPEAGPERAGRVEKVHAAPVAELEHERLGSPAGGPIAAVRGAGGRVAPVENHYMVEVRLDGPGAGPLWMSGRLVAPTAPRSLLVEAVRQLGRALLRESGM